MSEIDIEKFKSLEIDTRESDEASLWEERFEAQINTFFDEAIARVPGFVDRHLKSFRKTMGRSLGPRTGVGDIFISMRNLASGVSKNVGGPDFSTTTFTDDELTQAFEAEVVGTAELEGLLKRLFQEFEEEQWALVAEQTQEAEGDTDRADIDAVRSRLVSLMETEIAHDPLLAQAIRSSVKLGLPATLGYVLFGKVTFWGNIGSEAAGDVYKRHLDFYRRSLLKLGRFEVPTWVGAVGLAGGLLSTLAVGGVVEYAINSVRDIKGYYIRQINAARYVLLYGENPDVPEGQGILHVVRGLERQFERLPELTEQVLEQAQEDLVNVEADGTVDKSS